MRTTFALCIVLTARTVCAGELTGRLTLNDRPIAGITVSALPCEMPADQARREARREARPEAIAKAVTNAKGEFRIAFEVPTGQPGRLVSLAYAGPGVAQSWVAGRFDTADVEDVGDLAARKGAPLAGRVVDAEGRPVADAEVEHPTGPGSARTDSDGRFAFEGVGESGNDVVVRKPGYVAARASNVRGGATDRAILMRRGLPLDGVVVERDGTTPVPGAVVRVDGRDARASGETDAEGRFRIEEFGEGRLAVLADGGERGLRELTGVALPRPADSPLTLVLAPMRTAAGRVLDAATKKPVAGAVVYVSAGKLRFWTRSGANGSFALRTAPGDWRVTVSAPGYVRTNRQIARGQLGDKPVEILLREGATLSGRVTDDQRRPVAAARVRAMESENRGASGAPTAVTAEDGTFTVRRVPAVEATRLVVTHLDFEPAWQGDLGLKPGETRAGIAFSLRRGAVVTGIATAGGAPAAGVQVTVSPGRTGYGAPPRSVAGPGWSWPRATTAADGRFRIGGLAPGEYGVTAAKPGYARETREAVVAEGRGPDPLLFALESEAVIAGSLRGKRGTGIPDQSVNAMAADATSRSSGFARTLADGSFRIEGLKAGVAYNLFVYGAGGPNGPRKTATAPADAVEIVATGAGRIAGRVVDAEGRPVPEFQAIAQTDRTTGGFNWANSVRQDVSSETGEFVLENAPAVALEVRVVAKGYQAARVGGITVEEGETRSGVEVKLSRGATLRGRVVDAKSGRPLSEIEVSAESAPSGATTDSDGAFSIEGLAPGKARVTARGPEYAAASETAEVGESGGTVELKLSPGASVSAMVTSPGGDPLPGAEATLAQGGQNWSGTKAVAGPDGRVNFSHLAPGRYSLSAGSAGSRSKPVDLSLEVDQARDDVRVVVGGGATVLVTVTGLTPEERRQLSVMVYGTGNSVSAKELPDGRFEARDVPPGPTQALGRLGAQGEMGGRFVTRPLTVPEDGTLDVELPFEAGFTLTVRVLRDGQGVEGATVYASPATGQAGTTGNATTDASGTCRMTGLKAGAYRVMAYSFTTSGAAPEQNVDVSGDRTLELVFPSGRVSGRVVASGSLQPLSDAHVSIRTTNADGSFGMTNDATTDDTGRFQLTGLAAGPLTLTAQRKGYVVETRSVTADAAEDLVVELNRGDGLDVTGRDGLLGTPLGSFYVRVFDAAGTEILNSIVRLDSAGRGEIPSLKPGSYSIVAGGSGFAPAAFDGVGVPGPALAVALTPGGTLDVDVPAERIKAGPLKCAVTGPRGIPLVFRQWGNRGDLSVGMTSIHMTNFPAGAGTLTCPGSTSVPFLVPEGGTNHIAVR